MNEKLKIALKYAQKGYRVFPTHSITHNGSCTCLKRNCKAAGKHPIEGGWKFKATKDEKKIKKLWDKYSWANIGVALDSDDIVVDIDPKHRGDKTLREFEQEYGELPLTAEVKTGSGGGHLYYKKNAELNNLEIKNSIGLLTGVDIKTEGGYVIGAGSLHQSGDFYEESEFGFFDIEESVLEHRQLIELLTGKNKHGNTREAIVIDEEVGEGERHEFLFKLACSLQSRGLTPNLLKRSMVSLNEALCSPPIEKDELINNICSSAILYPNNLSKPKPSVPLSSNCFYGPIGELVRKAAPNTEASPIAILLQAILIVGSNIGRDVWFKNGTIKLHLNLYVVLVGKSGRSRKGTSLNITTKMLSKVYKNEFKSRIKTGVASGEGIIFNLRDSSLKFVKGKQVDVPGIDDKRLLLIEPEFGRVLGLSNKDGNILSHVLRDSYDSPDFLETLGKVDPVRASNPHVSLIGHITETEFHKASNDNLVHNGTLNRCAFIYVDKSQSLPSGGSDFSVEDEVRIIKSAISDFNEIDEITFSTKALNYWCGGLYSLLNQDSSNKTVSALSIRATDFVCKVASIYALVDKKKKISLEHLKASHELWRYCLESLNYIFHPGNYITENSKKILKELERVNKLTRTEVRNLFGRNKSKKEIDDIERELVDRNKIRIEKDDRTVTWHLLKPSEAKKSDFRQKQGVH